MGQVIVSVVLVLAGLYLSLVADAPPDTRLYGGVLVVVGTLGIVVGVVLLRRRRQDG